MEPAPRPSPADRAMSGDDGFGDACAAHRAALGSFVAAAARVPEAQWNRASAPGKWTPAQVAEHLRLSYAAVQAELDGRQGFRIRSSWWKQRLYQLLFLPRILRQGRMPRGVPAVREIRPADGPYPQRELLDALSAEGERLLGRLGEIRGERGARVSHPFLGRLTIIDGLQLSTHHIRHHQGQLPAVDGPT